MKFWLVHHSWESFKATSEYCGFTSETERDKINIGDKIAYYGQGIIFGIFEAIALVENEFKWKKPYIFQVKLKPIAIAEGGLMAKPIESKILLQKSNGGSSNLLEIKQMEFEQIKQAIDERKKELFFK